MQKKTYSQPKLNVYGNVETLTQNTNSGTKADQSIPANASTLTSLFS